MKKLTSLLLIGTLTFAVASCESDSKTAANAPDNSTQAAKTPEQKTVQDNQNDATSTIRKQQANSDIRAREQRNNITGGDTQRANSDLASEVRSKLEVNIPASSLAIDAKDGAVTVAGTVPNQKDLSKIDPLSKQIKGVKTVTVTATVAAPKN